MLVGIAALLTGKTGEIIIMACFGALSLYIVSMIAMLTLRKKEPDLPRPFRVPLYPVLPITALVVSSIAFIAMTSLNLVIAMIYFGLLALSFAGFRIFSKRSNDAQ